MKPTHYRLVIGSWEDVQTEVNQLMEAGWQPLGSPCVCSQDRPYELCQAMVRAMGAAH
ncbi:DUF1737 domain-containing protein [Fontisphaera persica]|uniref:DUF1737 domain-containing protein n=1 Tax=Fontisphaera persica TaxID=2974023 RepID=UPI0024C094C0|nr:DUF1737 domain-containing protein [Fontisphaera persica]WCJ57859.1 DUF1737 domain-containing protein [Fontisphaera persica]